MTRPLPGGTSVHAGPLRLLVLGTRPPPLGGTTVLVDQLLRELSGRRDVQVDFVETGRRPGAHFGYEAWRFARGISRADVVSIHASPPGAALAAPVLAAICRLTGRALVIRFFGGSLMQDLRGMPPRRRGRLLAAMRAATVLVETQELVRNLRRDYAIEDCVWFPNSRPVQEGVVRSSERDLPLRLVFLGHVKATKGIGEILEATPRSAKAAWKVDVYGPLVDAGAEPLIRAHPHVRYRGVLDPRAVPHTLAGYDALLLPTYHPGEGYPGVVLEAFGVGLPVVAARSGAIPEIVEQRSTGILIEPRSSASLQRALDELAGSRALLETLSARARQQARRFDSARWTETFVQLCRARARRGATGGGREQAHP